MSDKKSIWLAKSGATHGPFSEEQIEALRMTGAIQQYSWIKESEDADWKPIDPPPSQSAQVVTAPPVAPPDPPRLSVPPLAVVQAIPPKPRVKSTGPSLSFDRWEVLCHDYRNVVSGHIVKLSDEGCYMEIDTPSSDPCFAQPSPVILNLLDPRSGKMVNIQAKMTAARRAEGKWIYKIRWPELPPELAA